MREIQADPQLKPCRVGGPRSASIFDSARLTERGSAAATRPICPGLSCCMHARQLSDEHRTEVTRMSVKSVKGLEGTGSFKGVLCHSL